MGSLVRDLLFVSLWSSDGNMGYICIRTITSMLNPLPASTIDLVSVPYPRLCEVPRWAEPPHRCMKLPSLSSLIRLRRVDDVNDIPRGPTSPWKFFSRLVRVSSQPSFSSRGLAIHRLCLLKTRHSFIASNSQGMGQRRQSSGVYLPWIRLHVTSDSYRWLFSTMWELH